MVSSAFKGHSAGLGSGSSDCVGIPCDSDTKHAHYFKDVSRSKLGYSFNVYKA